MISVRKKLYRHKIFVSTVNDVSIEIFQPRTITYISVRNKQKPVYTHPEAMNLYFQLLVINASDIPAE